MGTKLRCKTGDGKWMMQQTLALSCFNIAKYRKTVWLAITDKRERLPYQSIKEIYCSIFKYQIYFAFKKTATVHAN